MAGYITGAQLLATLGVTAPNTQQTADANSAVSAASRAIDNLCDRSFTASGTVAASRYYSPRATDNLEIHDCSSVTILVSRDDGGNVDTADSGLNTWTANTDFFVEPLNPSSNPSETLPYTRLRVNPAGSFVFNTRYPRSVKVTGLWGWSSTPAAVTDASYLLAERLYKMKREAPLGLLAFQDAAVRIARADSNLMVLLGAYVKHPGAIA